MARVRSDPTKKPAAPRAALPPAPDAGAPLYQRLLQSLREGIESGGYALGADLPTETDLCTQFGLSRHTVREALRRLAELGYVERRQGSGTRVVSATAKVAYVHTVESLAELFQYTRDIELEIALLDVVTIDAQEAEEVQVPAGSRWLRIDGLRRSTAQQEVVCWTHVLVHLRFAGLQKEIRSARGPIYALLEQRSGEKVASALQEISARPLPAQAARALSLRPGAPGLRIVRRYLEASGGAMMIALNWYPAGRFTHVMHLKRDE